MQARYEQGGITWVDLESPTQAELSPLIEEFHIDQFVADELLLPSMRPRIESHGEYLYLVMHFPALRHTHKSFEQEIDFVVGRKFILTVRYDTIDPLHKFSKVFEVNSLLGQHGFTHAGFILFGLLKKLYRAVEHELEYVRRDLSHIEDNIYSGHEVAMVETISRSARDLLNLRQTIEPHRDVLRSLNEEGAAFFGSEFLPYLRGLENEYYRVHNHIMRSTETLHELRETNNSLVSTKQNLILMRFSILAFFTFPLTLFATIFSMDAVHMPIVGSPGDFWIITGIMLLVAVTMFLVFKHKKWL